MRVVGVTVLAIVAFVISYAVTAGIVVVGHSGSQAACGHQCAQDIASATYFSFAQLDCDGEIDSPNPSDGVGCTDELENVNRLPQLVSATQAKDGRVTVVLTLYYAGGPGSETDTLIFGTDGMMLGDRTTP